MAAALQLVCREVREVHRHAVQAGVARRAMQGIFATHLHQLLDAELATQRLEYWCMETRREEGGQLRPTMRMVPGTCTDSLALEVAAQSGLPPDVLHRAKHLYQVPAAARPDSQTDY